MDKQAEFVLRAVEERDIRFVRLWFTDILGALKSVAIAPAELEGAFTEDYVMVDWGPSFAYEYSQKYAGRTLATIQTNYGVMALDILKNKGGAAYLPDLKALREDESINLHEVKDAFVFERKLYAVFRKDTALNKEIETLINVINKNIRN